MIRYFMLIRNDKIYIKSDMDKKILEYTLKDLKVYPNIPMYNLLFEDDKIFKEIKEAIKWKLDNIGLLKRLLAKKQVFVLLPDDAVGIEKKAINELALTIFNPREVILALESAFAAPLDEQQYICISKTCRMVVITHQSADHNILGQRFIERRDYSEEELLSVVRELCGDLGSVPRIYLNGVELADYSDLGIVIDTETLMRQFEESIKSISKELKRSLYGRH